MPSINIDNSSSLGIPEVVWGLVALRTAFRQVMYNGDEDI